MIRSVEKQIVTRHSPIFGSRLEADGRSEPPCAVTAAAGVPIAIENASTCRIFSLRPFGSSDMKRLLWLLLIALALPSCIKHEPRSPDQVRRSEYRARKTKEREQRQKNRAENLRQQRAT